VTSLRDSRLWASIALAINLSALSAHVWLSHQRKALQVLPRGLELPTPSGLSPTSLESRAEGYFGKACHLVRYASATCAPSVRDHAIYLGLEQRAMEMGCSSTLVAPTPAEFPEPLEGHRINFGLVPLSFSQAMPFTATPTTMLADTSWVLEWSKIGALDIQDVEDALGRVARMGKE